MLRGKEIHLGVFRIVIAEQSGIFFPIDVSTGMGLVKTRSKPRCRPVSERDPTGSFNPLATTQP